VAFDPESFVDDRLRHVAPAGVRLRLHTCSLSVSMDGDRIERGVVERSAAARRSSRASLIDATGGR